MKWGNSQHPSEEVLNTPASSEITNKTFGHFHLSAECKLYFTKDCVHSGGGDGEALENAHLKYI